MEIPLKTGPWNLSELKTWPNHGKTVFSLFSCGGGSTMGYKLAGYDVIGCVEIDPEMMSIYKANHKPRFPFLMGVEEFNKIPNQLLPKELFDLDILDGSPPCSSFSMAGSREKAWGEKKKFREGQADQVLDDLFFHFINTAKKLQPKVVIAENVKGLIQGKAKGYVKEIFRELDLAGYETQLFLLNAAFMGVPQRRERTFFVASRRELGFLKIKINNQENPVAVLDATRGIETVGKELKTEHQRNYWARVPPDNGLGLAGGFNSQKKISINSPCFTQTASQKHWHWSVMAEISNELVSRLQTFPDDFDFNKLDTHYICGMSVPPFMMQRVALEVYKQWLLNE